MLAEQSEEKFVPKHPKRSLVSPPSAWFDLLLKHDLELGRVRLLWRRGAGPYRPLLAHADPNAAPDDPIGELDETHFDWLIDESETVAQQRDRVAQIVDRLWSLAIEWTAAQNRPCDYKLCGWDRQAAALFEFGCRCTVPSAVEIDDDDEVPDDADGQRPASPTQPPHTPTITPSREIRGSWQQLDAAKDQFIDRLTQDRNWSFDTAQQAMDAAPALLVRASEILKDTIEYQREEVAQLRDRSSGQTELRARAFAEMERTQRSRFIFDFLKDTVHATLTLGAPLANRLIEVMANRNMQVFPQFENSQQAFAYLALSLTQTQLDQLFPGKPQAGGAMLVILTDASKLEVERDALELALDLLPLFRDKRFRDVATPEQQLAGNFVIGRMAMFRMVQNG